ncbi:MAG: hypothetical protein NT157_00480 [Candidatus Micrarchaeota archaeon]|nr:hypothetical protein [Candidatus Micrarchaeota archaeon]
MIYGCSIGSDYFDWIPIVALVALITFILIAITYMVSQFMKRDDWALWAKIELYQTFIALILIGGIFGLSAMVCNISELIAGGDPFTIADRYLSDLVWVRMIPAIEEMFRLSFSAQKWAAFMIGILSCMEGICFNPFAGYGTISYNLETMAALITPFAASLLFQKLVLGFIKELAFTIILPAGFILKVFPFTRQAGAFIMALALGFYVVFPLTYVFNKALMDEVSVDSTFTDWCNNEHFSFQGGLGFGMCRALNTVGQILPQAVFLPALSMIITISFVESMARLFEKDYLLEW